MPQSILRSGALSAFCYLVPILLVLLVLPASKISGLGGFLDAVKASYTIYGGAASFMYGVTCVLFIFTLMNSGSAWMMLFKMSRIDPATWYGKCPPVTS